MLNPIHSELSRPTTESNKLYPVNNAESITCEQPANRLSTTKHNSILDGALEGRGQRFAGQDFRDLLRPGVYVLLRDGQPLYIGSSSSLLGRASHKDHAAIAAREECDEVLLFPCESEEAAQSLEGYLIGRLRPRDNKRLLYKYAQEILDVTPVGSWKILRAHGWKIKGEAEP